MLQVAAQALLAEVVFYLHDWRMQCPDEENGYVGYVRCKQVVNSGAADSFQRHDNRRLPDVSLWCYGATCWHCMALLSLVQGH